MLRAGKERRNNSECEEGEKKIKTRRELKKWDKVTVFIKGQFKRREVGRRR